MKYTIKDIADLCGVGKSTVSRVLNDDPNVKDETRKKIQAVIDRVGFEANRTARAMRGVVDPVVGIIVTRLNSPAESQTLSTILHELSLQGITAIVVESRFSADRVQQHLHLFKQRQVSGVILFAFSQLSEAVLHSWRAHLVVIARKYSGYSSVFYDDVNAIKLLFQHFYNQGYRNIGYLGVYDSDETTGKLRNISYLACCEEKHLTPNLVCGDLSVESAYQNFAQLQAQPLDAVICAGSRLAIGALKYLQDHQCKLPLACIGKNDVLTHLAPDLICLDLGYQQAGKLSVELILAQLNGQQTIEHCCVPVRFLE